MTSGTALRIPNRGNIVAGGTRGHLFITVEVADKDAAFAIGAPPPIPKAVARAPRNDERKRWAMMVAVGVVLVVICYLLVGRRY